eukprot:517800-Pyramimonas_sp.AAC.1
MEVLGSIAHSGVGRRSEAIRKGSGNPLGLTRRGLELAAVAAEVHCRALDQEVASALGRHQCIAMFVQKAGVQ